MLCFVRWPSAIRSQETCRLDSFAYICCAFQSSTLCVAIKLFSHRRAYKVMPILCFLLLVLILFTAHRKMHFIEFGRGTKRSYRKHWQIRSSGAQLPLSKTSKVLRRSDGPTFPHICRAKTEKKMLSYSAMITIILIRLLASYASERFKQHNKCGNSLYYIYAGTSIMC